MHIDIQHNNMNKVDKNLAIYYSNFKRTLQPMVTPKCNGSKMPGLRVAPPATYKLQEWF